MVQKKVYTMQDIANEVGVSKATVSYVLNNKKGARVSDATRKKILQVANLYNYVPNISARTLSQSQSKLIGVLINEKKDKRLRLDDNEFLSCLKNSFYSLDYNIVFIRDREHFDYIDLAYDAIIAINYDDEKINSIADFTFSPLVLIDSLNENFLFYKVHNDYSQAIKLAYSSYNNQNKCMLVYDKFSNNKMNQLISSHPNCLEYAYENKAALIKLFIENKHSNYIILSEALGCIAEQYLSQEQFVVICVDEPIFLNSTTKTIFFSNKYRADVVSEITDKLVKKSEEIYESEHEVKLKYISSNL